MTDRQGIQPWRMTGIEKMGFEMKQRERQGNQGNDNKKIEAKRQRWK